MANTLKKIQTVTVGSGGSATIEFTNIPQTYTDLKLVVSARNTSNFASNGYYYLVKPNNASTNLSSRYLLGIGTSVSSGTYTPYAYMAASDYTANAFSNNEHYFPNYTSSNNKSISTDGVNETNASTVYGLVLDAGLWSSNSAITSIVLSPGVGTFAQYSSATLYGVYNEVKATGGRITADENFIYHTFTSDGTFTPLQSLNVDYLVVAGGGGGGQNDIGGGGGAGGLRCTVGATGGGGSLESQLAVTAQAYSITVGAGGASASNGGNSIFSSITSTGGGAGHSVASGQSKNGGSGGGGNYASTAGGTATTGQGFAGGAGLSGAAPAAGGGGGASAVGANATASFSGAGGNGVTTSISGTSTTYAGGGGGGASVQGTQRGLGGTGGGGNGAPNAGSGTAGTANTGGGGGGGQGTGSGQQPGGSGIVIVRYAR